MNLTRDIRLTTKPMKKGFASLLIFCGIFLADCAANKNLQYNIPPDIQGKKKEELLATLEIGSKLYEAHCAECHGIFAKGKKGAPNFTDRQFDSYAAYAIKHDPRNHAVAANMSTEQLHEVIMFLKLRKRTPNKSIKPNVPDTSSTSQVPKK